jgi:type IV pilus assembly protein PilF
MPLAMFLRSATASSWKTALAGLCTAALASTFVGSCAHTPTEQEKARSRGHYEAAISFVHEAQKAGEQNDGVSRDGKFREALRELLDAEKAFADDPALQLLTGQVYFLGFRRHVEAERHLRRAIELTALLAPADAAPAEREFPEADQTLGVVLIDAGRPAEAVPHLERARTNLLYATPYFAEQELGTAYFLLGRHDEAARHLMTAIQLQPVLCGAYTRLAEVEEARGADARVQKALGDFFARCDTDRLRSAVGPAMLAPALYRLGQSQLRTGGQADAVQTFTVCVRRFPGEAAGRECLRQLETMGVSVTLESVTGG